MLPACISSKAICNFITYLLSVIAANYPHNVWHLVVIRLESHLSQGVSGQFSHTLTQN
jgi:hypothetical protein